MNRSVAAALLVALLLLAACGGGGSEASGGEGDATLTGATDAPVTINDSGPLAGVQEFTIPSAEHLTNPIEYRQTPPVGGDHTDAWTTCGAYAEPVESANAVHSLQHGAVWITYEPGLAAEQVELLQALTIDDPFVLVTPWVDAGMESPIVLSAWGLQLGVDSAEDRAVEAFVAAYSNGPQNPEPGAPCLGGVGDPISVSRAPA